MSRGSRHNSSSSSRRVLCLAVVLTVLLGDGAVLAGPRAPPPVTYSFTPGSRQGAEGAAPRVLLHMNKVNRGGCPYTASFLCTSQQYVKHMKYGLKWQKMEAANWNAISSHRFKYQLHNVSSYFVNHMSAFEHSTRKKYGYDESENKTLDFSKGAVRGECTGIELVNSYVKNTLALVPFYGGRPPNVTANLKVNSIGQGNSLVKGEIKAQQTLAVVCSLLRHFATVVVGVARAQDHQYIDEVLLSLDATMVAKRVKVLPLETYKPANLPFALLEFGRSYIEHVNECVRNLRPADRRQRKKKRTKKMKLYNMTSASLNNSACNPLFSSYSTDLISYVYYTESDQILSFSDIATRQAIMSAVNYSTFIIGRRMEKVGTSKPTNYMKDLTPTRALCGDPKDHFVLDWPASHFIQKY